MTATLKTSKCNRRRLRLRLRLRHRLRLRLRLRLKSNLSQEIRKSQR